MNDLEEIAVSNDHREKKVLAQQEQLQKQMEDEYS